MQLGEAYRDVARYQDAVRVIREALALDPKPAQVLEFARDGPGRERADGGGGAGVRGGDDTRAGNGLYAYNRGLALQQLGRRDEALASEARG